MEHARPPGELAVEGGPAARANAWRKCRKQFEVFIIASGVSKRQRTQPKREEPVDEILPSTSGSGQRDEPLYDIGPHSSLIPQTDVYCQNFEFSGFIPLVNETYEKMRAVDPRLHDRLPLSMYTHAMATHLNLEILEVARKAGQNVLNLRTDAREILPDYQVVPQAIADYISHVAEVITQDGKEVRLNRPSQAIPQGPIMQNHIEISPSGTFGALNAENHNLYECYISPYVTSARITASQQRNQEYGPLPEELIPGNLVPNRNLLGFEDIDINTHGAAARLDGIVFPNDNTLEGRYRYSPLLHTRVYTILAEMKDRFKMLELRREQNPQGLNLQDRIKRRVTAVNLAFVESIGPVNDADIPLFLKTADVHSFGAQGSAVSNQANIETLHRRRVTQARGLCCLTEAGNAPGGWVATCNSNFNMAGIFGPVLHADYPQLRESHFSSRGPAGNRTNALTNFIDRNYYKVNR
ncbi:unnamed protein product [Pieris macdunnoughi]|uniref:Uncharacterized protein n=1 Tax=Pieris macdunnoughi TaxID=345717 RepID=A0A821XPJ4_9NEOP|nr:unnamed protein product [Pieris macdunnoughi]